MKKLKKMFCDANIQIQKIKDYIIKHEDIFSDMNLKLHDLSYYIYTNMEKDFPLCYEENQNRIENSYFDLFCTNTYCQFIEWCEEQKIDFYKICHHIGRTSSFYLYDKEIIQRDHGKIRWDWTMYNCINELGCSSYYQIIEFAPDGNIDEEKTLAFDEDYWTQSEWINEVKPAVQYIIDDMYNDFIKEVEDIIKVYEYIKDIKDNQVDYFKEWLQFYEDELIEENIQR